MKEIVYGVSEILEFKKNGKHFQLISVLGEKSEQNDLETALIIVVGDLVHNK